MEPAALLLAFTAGLVAFFSPCCIAMLPAYVGYSLRNQALGEPAVRPMGQRRLGLAVGAVGIVPLAWGGWPLLQIGLSSFGLGSGPSFGPGALSEIEAAVLVLLGVGALVTAASLTVARHSILRGALMGAAATLGFLTVFLAIGLPIALAARFLVPYIPLLAVFVGAGLVVLGALTLAGRAPSLPMRLRAPRLEGSRGFYLFGIGYGLASLSCTFPVFLAVVAGALFAGGVLGSLSVFAAYALGKGTLLVGVTILASAGAGGSAQGLIRRALPRIEAASALLLVVTGAYVAWYFGRTVFL